MKIKNLLFVVLATVGSFTVSAQSNLLNAKTPEEIGKKTAAQLNSDNDKPLPYGYVHDRDVLMGKTIWEFIDIDERINFPLYYPIDTAFVGKERRSLFDVLVKNIKNGKITEVYADDYFNTKKTLSDMSSSFRYTDTIQAGFDEINNFYDDYKSGRKVLDKQFINQQDLTAQDISGYKIKGYWYFDKRQGELKYRLLAICPVTPEARDIGKDNPDVIDLFWVYFPAIRDVLHEAKAFNDKNSAMPITFDHLLNSRRFNGSIYKEENVYGDREIQQYMKENSQNQLLESERIKEKIRSFESDMWNY
ncbi:gliding motility protein GldN [Flavobacterium dankookense]|uniref:Protein involved in gliding motility GldN n=1 Tax=Flavobacterium dankookense TaxID=706186 RepID=A0A4V3CRY5_9FLAO|nr:gliding motility protein GldN [Flavobacterium dankookense]TDP58272.1 protein involved in gliding motility GldN [Flavobacterium dankookense]